MSCLATFNKHVQTALCRSSEQSRLYAISSPDAWTDGGYAGIRPWYIADADASAKARWRHHFRRLVREACFELEAPRSVDSLPAFSGAVIDAVIRYL